MSIAAAHYDKFKQQVAREGRVFTFTDRGGYLVFPVGAYEAIPFWSSRSRLARIQARRPRYRGYRIEAIRLTDFIDWLERVQHRGVRIGVNWCGDGLVGYDAEARHLIAGLHDWMERLRPDPSRC